MLRAFLWIAAIIVILIWICFGYVTMINEAKSAKANARIVAQNGVPQVPMLLFISDGTGGTGFDKETWRRYRKNISQKWGWRIHRIRNSRKLGGNCKVCQSVI